MNKVIMIGNLVVDPEGRITSSGKTQSNFRIAVQRRTTNPQGTREADFFNVVAWDKTAGFVNRYLSKGRKIALEGSLRNRSYEAQDGSKRNVTEILAASVEVVDKREEQRRQERQLHESEEYVEVDPDDELPF